MFFPAVVGDARRVDPMKPLDRNSDARLTPDERPTYGATARACSRVLMA